MHAQFCLCAPPLDTSCAPSIVLLQVGVSELMCSSCVTSGMLRFLMLLQMEKFEKSLESVQRSFSTIRTGRATPTMLDRVQVG